MTLQTAFLLNKIFFAEDVPYATLSTVGCGGRASVAIYPDSVPQFITTLQILCENRTPFFIFGRGSNVLTSDDWRGIAVVTTQMKGTKWQGDVLQCDCGVSSAAAANALAMRGFSGGEFLSCLPATIGGAVAGNAGCFGQDASGLFRSARCFSLDSGKIFTIYPNACSFAKRSSVFLSEKIVILSVDLLGVKKTPCEVFAAQKSMLSRKTASQPLDKKSLGCVFCNSSGTASALIDAAGLKGTRVGGAVVSPKHANFIINEGGSAEDFYNLMLLVERRVYSLFGEKLRPEIRLVGFE